ncbi:MAG: MarR family transcriptional regulator [Candidatus Dormibacteraeota bacterium]|nr:MarR family transcriptional regulator [Candidatus Dormibacteraeota bacterium]
MPSQPDSVDSALLAGIDSLLRVERLLERVPTPLTVPQYRILRMVEAGGERAARLADRLAVRKPTLTAVADGLVQAGFLVRETEVLDRRVVRLCLTGRGAEALQETERAYVERVRPVIERASDPARLLELLVELQDPAPSPALPGTPVS